MANASPQLIRSLFRQPPHPKTQERRDHGKRRADPKWNGVTADNDLGVLEQADNMAQRNGREEQRCDS